MAVDPPKCDESLEHLLPSGSVAVARNGHPHKADVIQFLATLGADFSGSVVETLVSDPCPELWIGGIAGGNHRIANLLLVLNETLV